jgi:hypothetical protein
MNIMYQRWFSLVPIQCCWQSHLHLHGSNAEALVKYVRVRVGNDKCATHSITNFWRPIMLVRLQVLYA